MRILIVGATGTIGVPVVQALEVRHEVNHPFNRTPSPIRCVNANWSSWQSDGPYLPSSQRI